MFNLIFCAAFMTGWFTYFINVIVYFISISEYFATLSLPELSVLFLDKSCQPMFYCKCLIKCHTQRLTILSKRFLQLWSTEVHLYHLCHIKFSGVSYQHVATFILRLFLFTGLFIVQFFLVVYSLFPYFSYHFFVTISSLSTSTYCL